MKLLSAEYLFDGETLLEQKAVALHNDIVVDIGSINVMEHTYQIKAKNLGKGLLFPGFVNLHTHFELSYLKNRLPEKKGFVEWLKNMIIKKKEELNDKASQESMEKGIKESFESGVRIAGDISNTLASCPYLKKYMQKSVVFFENYGLKKDKACSAKNELAYNIKKQENLCKNITISPTAHAVYSTHSCLIKYLANLNQSLPFSIHLLESSFEKDFLLSKGELFELLDACGLIDEKLSYENIFDYLGDIGSLRKNSIFVHCAYADKNDFNRIKNIDSTVCLCLRSNDFISGHLPDVYDIEKSGVNVGIGTDSLASNWDLNFLNELGFIYKKFSKLNPEAIFKWATSGGAKALNIKFGFKKNSLSYEFFIPSCTKTPLEEILSNGRG